MSSGIFQFIKEGFSNPQSIYGVIMKKNLLALALIGSISGLACAQSNVTIYGIVDTGFIKETGFRC